MTLDDLADEIDHSEVYDSRTKRQLASILNLQCRLATILTDPLVVCYGPSAFDLTYSLDNFDETVIRITAGKERLACWKNEVDETFGPSLEEAEAHRSTRLISSVVHIYA
jgi:hypothetical protein